MSERAVERGFAWSHGRMARGGVGTRAKATLTKKQGCSRSIDLGGKDQDHLIELDLLW